MKSPSLDEREKKYLDSLKTKETKNFHNIFLTPKVICETH